VTRARLERPAIPAIRKRISGASSCGLIAPKTRRRKATYRAGTAAQIWPRKMILPETWPDGLPRAQFMKQSVGAGRSNRERSVSGRPVAGTKIAPADTSNAVALWFNAGALHNPCPGDLPGLEPFGANDHRPLTGVVAASPVVALMCHCGSSRRQQRTWWQRSLSLSPNAQMRVLSWPGASGAEVGRSGGPLRAKGAGRRGLSTRRIGIRGSHRRFWLDSGAARSLPK
jgi:hypothetical protein